MSQLPPGWANTELGAFAETRLGKMLSKKAKVGTEPRPYLRNKSVQWGRIDLDDLPTMDFDPDEFERFQVRVGDLLVCEGGEVGRAAIWRGQLDWVGYQKALHRVRPRAGISPEFLLYGFMWLAQSHALEKHVTGSTIKHLPQEDLRQIAIPLPPLDEQRRIVAAIEEELSRLDAADASLAAAATRMGVLSEQLDAEVLGNWETGLLGSICPIFVDCPHRTPEYSSEGIPALRPRDVAGGKLRLDTAARVGRTEFELQTKRRVPCGGDVIYSRELSFGWAVVVPEGTELCLSQGMLLLRPGDEMLPQFLAFVLNSSVGRRQAESVATGSAHPHLNLRDIRAYELPLPPLDEQRRIVARVEEQLSAIDALRAAIERARRRSASLRRAVLERAFRGELVPQDPSDEPASVLLDRIGAERTAAASSKRSRSSRSRA